MAYGDPYKGTVNYHNPSTGRFEVLLAGNLGDVNARDLLNLQPAVGDTVTVVQIGDSEWKITELITPKSAPVVSEVTGGSIPSPPSTSISIPSNTAGAITNAGSINLSSFMVGFPIEGSQPWNSDVVSRINQLASAFARISNYINDDLLEFMDDVISWAATVDNSVSETRSSFTQTRNGLGDVGDYAEDVGAVAGPAIDGANQAIATAVAAGAAVYVKDFSITALPPVADKFSAYSTADAAKVSISGWLDHRRHWIREIHAGLNRGLAFKGRPQCPALSDPLWDLSGMADWSAMVSRIQGLDDWAMNAASSMLPYIADLNSQAGTGAPTYPGGSRSWSNTGTFESSKAALMASCEAWRTYYTQGLGTMTVRAIRKINGGA